MWGSESKNVLCCTFSNSSLFHLNSLSWNKQKRVMFLDRHSKASESCSVSPSLDYLKLPSHSRIGSFKPSMYLALKTKNFSVVFVWHPIGLDYVGCSWSISCLFLTYASPLDLKAAIFIYLHLKYVRQLEEFCKILLNLAFLAVSSSIFICIFILPAAFTEWTVYLTMSEW